MKFKCPSCLKVSDFPQDEIRKIFLKCPDCSRQFRPSECSPIMSADKKQDKAMQRDFSTAKRDQFKQGHPGSK